MNTLIVFIESASCHPDEWVIGNGGSQRIPGEFIVETGGDWLSLTKEPSIFEDYEDSEEKQVRNLIKVPFSSYIIEWRGISLLQELINNLDPTSVIDNDHGLICLVTEVKDKEPSSWITSKNL